ncbi:MAG: glycosyltransferase [Thermoplasmatales archaeon]
MECDRCPEFTIIIPTHNRYEKLRNLIYSIAKVKPENLREVIVVDDSSNKEDITTWNVGINIRTISLENRTFISRAKNIGLSSALTEFVFFIDDDNLVSELTFHGLIDVLSRDESIAAVSPSVLYSNDNNLVWVYATPFKKGKWGHDLIGRNRPRNPEFENKIIDTDALPNAFVAKKSLLESVGGFNEDMPVYNSAYLAYCLKRKGYRVVSYTGSFIFHDVELPKGFGYWAEHQLNDPDRVYIEIRDWVTFMKVLHQNSRLFPFKAIIKSMSFVIPNSIVYLLKGRKIKILLLRSEITALIEGLRAVIPADFGGCE